MGMKSLKLIAQPKKHSAVPMKLIDSLLWSYFTQGLVSATKGQEHKKPSITG